MCAGTGAARKGASRARAHAYQKAYFDRSRRHDKFEVGNSILLSTKNLHLTGSHKLRQYFTGPFQVV